MVKAKRLVMLDDITCKASWKGYFVARRDLEATDSFSLNLFHVLMHNL